jgi:metallopeptidase MepB
MNYNKPLDNHPTLLRLTEVRKLFHELGHLHHGLCTEAKYSALAHVDRDFIEAPSLMFEQFFWQGRHIRDVSFHYSHISPEFKQIWLAGLKGKDDGQGDEDVPVQLSDADVLALATPNLRKFARRELWNLFFSMYDVLVHSPSSHEELEKLNLAEAFNKLATEVLFLHGGEALGEGWEWTQRQSVYRAIVSGYAAGYYAYVLYVLLASSFLFPFLFLRRMQIECN